MYTWGYIKKAAKAKLDLDENETSTFDIVSKFYIYANEAMTQICSSVKPKETFEEVDVTTANTIVDMPSDFIRFGDDVNYFTEKEYRDYDVTIIHDTREASDDDFVYRGYKQILCKKTGVYNISYSARWFVFTDNMKDNDELNVPDDILDCLPSYIASQCAKMDDDTKASIFRNEYEIALSRIDNTDYKNTKTFKLGGDWY